MSTIDPVLVHVANTDDFKITETREVEPEHFISNAYVLPSAGPVTSEADANLNVPVQILQLDLARKETVISVTGNGNVYFAHSQAQAQSLQQSADQPADGGFLATAPCTFRAQGTGPLWAVMQTGSGGTTSQSAVAGTGTFTAAGGSASLPAYVGIQYLTGFDVQVGTLGTATTPATVTVSNVDNGPLVYYLDEGSATYANLSVRYGGTGLQAIGGAPTVTVSALLSGASGSVNVYGDNASGTSLVVGVLQERRGA